MGEECDVAMTYTRVQNGRAAGVWIAVKSVVETNRVDPEKTP
jgi:hypothetical protein